MKNDANIRIFIEITRKAHGKYAENHGIFKEFIPQPLLKNPFTRSFPVIFGRFCNHFRSFLDMIPIHSGFFPFLFLFIPQPLVFLPQMLKFS